MPCLNNYIFLRSCSVQRTHGQQSSCSFRFRCMFVVAGIADFLAAWQMFAVNLHFVGSSCLFHPSTTGPQTRHPLQLLLLDGSSADVQI